MPDTLPPDLEARRAALTPSDLVNLALTRSPATRASWLEARAAAAELGTARSALFPDIVATVNLNRLKTAATSGRVSARQTTWGPSLSFEWLLWDFGGRSGSITAAESALDQANWTHNAVVADQVRRTMQEYFALVGARSLVAAEQTSLNEAATNLAAAEDRQSVGVATIADVLEARTAMAQARLALQQAQGDAAGARGALATLIALPPDAAFDIDTAAAAAPIAELNTAVDSLMTIALRDRPDLAAERALVDVREGEARTARSAYLPHLSATGNTGSLRVIDRVGNFTSYNVGLSLSIPVFDGLGWEFNARAASFTAQAEAERLRSMAQQVALDVFLSYQAVRTATQNVAAAEDLFASASASVDAALARYRQGVGSLLDLLTTQSALANARAQRIESRVAWHTALIQLTYDAGLLGSTTSARSPLAQTPGINPSPPPSPPSP